VTHFETKWEEMKGCRLGHMLGLASEMLLVQQWGGKWVLGWVMEWESHSDGWSACFVVEMWDGYLVVKSGCLKVAVMVGEKVVLVAGTAGLKVARWVAHAAAQTV